MPKSQQEAFSSPPPEPFKVGEAERTLEIAALEHGQHALDADPSPMMRMHYAQLLASLSQSGHLEDVAMNAEAIEAGLWRRRFVA